MEQKKVHLEFDCTHNQAEGTMTLEWLNGRVQLVVNWKSALAVVLVNGDVRRTIDITEMSIDEFMRIEEQTQAAAEQLAAFEPIS